jgi:poly(3-hydroxybutyrate) depolymerase
MRRSNYPLFLTFIASLLGSSISMAASSTGAASSTASYGGRDMIVTVPAQLPPPGARALVVVLHGGMGNAGRIASGQSESGLNMDAVAEKDGFIVAYLNGTPATRLFGNMRAWNAGGCCGQPAENNIDDTGYIKGAVGYLIGKYGVDPARVYGMGHSNGAMMTERVMCETGLYAAAVAISGPLILATASCPAARGKHILAIHGADDRNVPVKGGKGTKGISGAVFNSEAEARQVFTNSGASYDLQIVLGADHKLDDIDRILRQTEGISIAQKATRFFGLD